MRYEAWIEDPVMLTAPYKIDIPWQRNPNYEFYEYACHEGNVQIRGYITATSPRFEALRQEQWAAQGNGETAVGTGRGALGEGQPLTPLRHPELVSGPISPRRGVPAGMTWVGRSMGPETRSG